MKPIEECKHETDSSIINQSFNEKESNQTKSSKKFADDFLISSNIQLIENELDLNFSKSDRSQHSYETNKLSSQVSNFKIVSFPL